MDELMERLNESRVAVDKWKKRCKACQHKSVLEIFKGNITAYDECLGTAETPDGGTAPIYISCPDCGMHIDWKMQKAILGDLAGEWPIGREDEPPIYVDPNKSYTIEQISVIDRRAVDLVKINNPD